MTLIVETGTNVANANSYCDLTFADNYFTLFNNSDWTGDTTTALIQATASVDLLYGQRFQSTPLYYNQALLWPRYTLCINGSQIISAGTIPVQLKKAVCEIALLSLQGVDIFPKANTNSYLKQDIVKLGDLEFNSSYNTGPASESYEGFNKIDLILAPLLNGQTVGYVPARFVL
jgi:hypothetical protein